MRLQEDTTRALIRTALEEDLAYGPDLTSLATVEPGSWSTASVATRSDGVIAGRDIIGWTLAELVDGAETTYHCADGDQVARGQVVATITAPTIELLTAERTLLNLLTHLSGIATATAAWVEAIGGTGAHTRVRDTRKTLPGLRAVEKYAVAAGGGVNHRMGLGDAALIKDNHVAATGGVVEALARVRARYPEAQCEVEVDTLEQFDAVLEQKPAEILLDNFTVAECAEAVRRRAGNAPEVLLEASGGLSLDKAADYAATGVDFLAVGALTHSVKALDLGLDFEDFDQ
ncbi:carboxylating nicotinate-nucleotide diphosphorylase [Corynebacterium yudongzhengii]|uniref:Nicotinate-nucleotide pyrophosphorylase [carboxylating] n=1 Tax=Corynebacterium yudongzhengii TaxID=2080740 RepID=A0A2U1T6S1_9CORY|nr:carboxylating nicotinate-nucleotide diphosphorylase [Corynebacterium yudongzhengii]AWB82243.1 carboxylating nicotinate-nucleotide diphosphorylase [Corynebacterium yudongzhengii]PWC01692.1 carboxylating nicotinate-nucleotide diphosphorylase [Corynebacterium yudongzhengii]